MREKFKDNNYINWGLTLFGVVAASIVLFFVLSNMNVIFGWIVKIFGLLTPIFLGVMFAYLLNPLVKLIEKFFTKQVVDYLYKKVFKKAKRKEKLPRMFAIFITYTLAIVIIVLFIKFVIPSLFDSLNLMLSNIPVYINNIYDYLKDILKSNSELMSLVDKMNTNITDFVGSLMIPSMDTVMTNITVGISSFVKWIINIVIGLIVSVYLIYDKDSFVGGTKKVLRAFLPKKIYETTMTTLGYVDKIFGGFMVAKIIDSILIGLITFAIISIFQIPYALIISVIVGITNIIPYFGPFIGAIPCAILLFLINPTKSLTFIVLILLIQQFDGNILGPKLIGDRTGMKSFWVLFAILLFGGLFGFMGMIFGVPVFAVIYSVAGNFVNKKLAKKGSL